MIELARAEQSRVSNPNNREPTTSTTQGLWPSVEAWHPGIGAPILRRLSWFSPPMRDFFGNLCHRAAVAGGERAIIGRGSSLSYEDLLSRVRAVAQWSNHLPKRVGILFGKTTDGIVTDLALSFAGKELVRDLACKMAELRC